MAMQVGCPIAAPSSAASMSCLKLRSSAMCRLVHLRDDLGENLADFSTSLLRRAALQLPDRQGFRNGLSVAVPCNNLAREHIFAGLAQELLKMGPLTGRLRVEVRRQQPEELRILAAIAPLHADHGLHQPFDAFDRIVFEIDRGEHMRGRNQTADTAQSK